MTQPIYETALLLEVDGFFAANPQSFREAFGKLFSNIPGTAPTGRLVMDVFEAAVKSGLYRDRSIIETVPLECALPLMIVYRHLSAGEPLFLDAPLIIAWKVWEQLGNRSISQCRACGARYPGGLPVPIPCCALCKSALGPVGCWQGGKVGAALVN